MDSTGSKDPLVGSAFDDYQIESRIARGGMSTVYRAEHTKLQKPCALKILDSSLAGEAKSLARFKQEAHLATKLEHVNLMRVYSFGVTTRGAYIAAELLQGDTLKELIDREGKLAPERAGELFRQICDGVNALHQVGIIHRDLKPQNIMVQKNADGSETIKIMDLGVAKNVSAPGSMALTATGEMLGTLPYMSPEHLKAQALDARTDIYSLGCILYEMLTGSPLNNYKAPMEVMKANPVKRVCATAHLSESLKAVICRAVAADREERYADALDLCDAVRKALSGQAIAVPPTPQARARRRRVRMVVVATGACIAALFMFAVVRWNQLAGDWLRLRFNTSISRPKNFADVADTFIALSHWLKQTDMTTPPPYDQFYAYAVANYGGTSSEYARALTIAVHDPGTIKGALFDEIYRVGRVLVHKHQYEPAIAMLAPAVDAAGTGKRKWSCEVAHLSVALGKAQVDSHDAEKGRQTLVNLLNHIYGHCYVEVEDANMILGNLARDSREPRQALDYHQHAGLLYEHNRQFDANMLCLAEQALDFQCLGNNEKAQELFQDIFADPQWQGCQTDGHFMTAAQILTNYAVFLSPADQDAARKQCDIAVGILKQADKHGFKDEDYALLADRYTALSEAYKKARDFKVAAEMEHLAAEAMKSAGV